ncbi:hypothetical protein BDW22DRAFT_592054 [Trametopsis cervina]|nr:hypothetical protein BDW22DRAFT_592054 [Trametopsis cervina]
MSHSHSHAPGQPSHSHGPAPPQAVQGGQPPKQVMPQPDPVMQAVIEASFKPVDIALGPPDNVVALCEKHSREICADCDVNFVSINQISRLLHMNPRTWQSSGRHGRSRALCVRSSRRTSPTAPPRTSKGASIYPRSSTPKRSFSFANLGVKDISAKRRPFSSWSNSRMPGRQLNLACHLNRTTRYA